MLDTRSILLILCVAHAKRPGGQLYPRE